LIKTYGPAIVDEACAAALECGATTYRFVRRYLEHRPAAPLTLRQVDPLIRELTHYRAVIAHKTPGGPLMTLVELQRALRQLRCSGMAAGLEGRLLQAQAEKLAPIDFLSTLVQDELLSSSAGSSTPVSGTSARPWTPSSSTSTRK
jgi:hypothetical protein